MSITMNDLSKFKFYAHKVMPLVFDESLSYYEFLCKVIAKLNEVIENENEQNTAIEDFSVQMDEWNEEAIQKYNEFTAQIDVAIEEFETQVTQGQTAFETEMGERADAFEDNMQEQWDEFFERYLQTLGVVQETGSSTTDVMSQKAVTDELNRRVVVDGATGVGLRSARNASGEGNTGVGENAIQFVTTGARNTGVGFNAGNPNATGNYNTNVGYNSRTSANDTFSATAVGRETRVASQSVAVGDSAKAEGALGTAIGKDSSASGARSVALGAKANASHAGSVAIGADKMNNSATTTAEEEIVLGTERHTVKIPGRLANPQIDGATLNSPILQSSTVINGGTSNGTRLNTPSAYDMTVRATTPTPVLGDELISNITTWGGENATLDSNNRWVIADGGIIRGNVEVSANTPYLVILTVVTNTAITPNERVIPCHIALGDDSIDIFGANDANWAVLLVPTTGGTVVASVGGGEWHGTIANVSIKEVTDFGDYAVYYQGSTKGIAMPSSSVYIGTGGCNCALAGSMNVSVGYDAQKNLKTGKGNSAVGEYAQMNITNGSYNVGIGHGAQRYLTEGMYNYGIGYSSQSKITRGAWNVAIGNESQRDLTTGCNNVSLGRRAHNDMTTGNKNVAIGAQAGFARKTTGEQTTTAYSTKTAEEQVLIGFQATQTLNTQGTANGAVAIGARAMANTDSVAIGRLTKAGAAGSVAIGVDSSGNAAEAVDENEIVIGTEAHTIKLCGKIISFNQDGTVTWTAE